MKELFRLKIPMVSCSLNEWYSQNHWSKRDKHKKVWRGYFQLNKQTVPIIKESDYPLIVETISHFKDNRRRDPDNYICANKLICDSLVEIEVIPDDNYKYISQHRCSIGGQKVPESYTELIIYSDEFKLT